MRLVLISAILLGVAQLAPARSATGLLHNGWRHGLATAGAVLMLAVPFSPGTALAQKKGEDKWKRNVPAREREIDRDHWREVFAGSPAEFRSVLNLQIDSDHRHSIKHLLYLGQDRSGAAVFTALWSATSDFLLMSPEETRHETSTTLQAWDGTVWKNVEADHIRFFPVAELDFYGLALIRSTDLVLEDYAPVQLAGFPAIDTPLNHLSYFWSDTTPFRKPIVKQHHNGDGHVEQDKEPPLQPQQNLPPLPHIPPPLAEQGDDLSSPLGEMSLLWRRCRAGVFTRETWLGTHNCTPFPDEMMQGSVIFNALTGDAVGFYLIKVEPHPQRVSARRDRVVGFTPAVLDQVEAIFSVSPYDKLPVSWGALKNKQ